MNKRDSDILEGFLKMAENKLKESTQGKTICPNCEKRVTEEDLRRFMTVFPKNDKRSLQDLVMYHTLYGVCSKECAKEFLRDIKDVF